jgi:NAD(P)-dependent dehydrogenase (short-subunit alcohol dehydrogenase family)
MELELHGKTALITGASRGIGLATAARYLEAGANVMLTSRTAEDLAAAAEGLDPGGNTGRVAWQAAHVGHPEDAESCVAATVAAFGGLDILVNNAGTNPYFGPMLDIDVVRAQKTFEVNQLSVVVWTAAAVRAGLGRGGVASGSVINVASIGGLGVEPGIGWYNVTKAAVLHITKQLAYELAPDIRVNALAPGLVKTKLASALWEGPGEERIAAHIPLRRLGLPDDIATAALFLASDASSWMSGQTMVIDGGTTQQPSGGVG